MKKLGLILAAFVAVFALNACIPDISETNNDYSVDNSDNSLTFGDGDVLICDNSTCSIAPDGTSEDDGNVTVGVFDSTYTQTECTAAGFFWCTIENACIDVPTATGTCPN